MNRNSVPPLLGAWLLFCAGTASGAEIAGPVDLADKSVTSTPSPPAKRTPLAAATKITFNELPDRVQRVLRSYTTGADVQDLAKGTVQGHTVYDAAVRRNGQLFQLRFASDGTLVRDDINDRYRIAVGALTNSTLTAPIASGRAPGLQSGTGSGSSAPIALPDAKQISFDQLPVQVMSAIQAQAGAVALCDLVEGRIDGRTIYQATITPQGHPVHIRVTPEGALLDETAAARPQ